MSTRIHAEMLYLLLACAPHHAYLRTPEDMAGDWIESQERARLTIRFDAVNGATATLTELAIDEFTKSEEVSAAAVTDPAGQLHFSTRFGRYVAFHSLRFGDPDMLIDDLEIEDRETRLAFHRDSAEGRARLATEKAAVAASWAEREPERVIEGIRIAELSFDAAFDQYVPCGPEPRAIAALTPTAVEFRAVNGFDRIGWTADEPLTGTYQVTVSADGRSFTVDGWQDLDGDGVPAHWTGDAEHGARRVSPDGVR